MQKTKILFLLLLFPAAAAAQYTPTDNLRGRIEGDRIFMYARDSNGVAAPTEADFNRGADYIDSQLAQKKPVIVAVDYRTGCSMGLEREDRAGDHFVIIVGGGRTKGYHYFDPATGNHARGTSKDNLFRREGNMLVSTNTCNWIERHYTLTSIRTNK